MMTMTMTTYLFLVVARGGDPTIRLLELAQVPGQPSPLGTSRTMKDMSFESTLVSA